MKIQMMFKHSLFFKFALSFLFVGLIPIFVLSILSLYQFTGQIERHTVNNIKQMMVYLSMNANDIYTSYNEISKMIYSKVDASAIFSGSASEINAAAMDNFLKDMLFSDPSIQNVLFIPVNDSRVYQQSRGSKRMDPLEIFPWVEWDYWMKSHPKQLGIFPYHMETYYRSQDMVMTFARNWINTSNGVKHPVEIYGSIYVDVNMTPFDHLLQPAQLGSRDEIYILNNDGIILYSNRWDKMGGRFNEASVKSRGDRMVFTEPLPFIQGQVVGLVSKEDIYSPIERTKTSVWMAAVFSFAALLVIGTQFSRMFTRPILEMMRHMNKVESGNLETMITIRRKDEMGRLANGFNRMVERLKTFINEVYVHELKRKQAELNALKNQIRPHYLYNTLEVIRMSAFANGDRQVADMIHSLSGQLEYVIDFGEETVELKQELEHLGHYFHLIEVRFDRRIALEVDIRDEELLEMPVFKLMVQPLVENAVQHGIRPKGNKGNVLIVIERIDDSMYSVSVYDDGVGMSQERLEALRQHLSSPELTSGKSIGIKNVQERIKGAYGEPFGLDIESRPHIGTSVRILLPVMRRCKDEQNQNDTGR